MVQGTSTQGWQRVDPGERLAVATECANGLASLNYSDAKMLLEASGFSTSRDLQTAVSSKDHKSRSLGYMALLRYGKEDKLLELRKYVNKLGIADARTTSRPSGAVGQGSQIFIVHGHNHSILYQVVRILERVTDR